MSDDIREEAAGEAPAVTATTSEKPAGTLAETGATPPPMKADAPAAEPAKGAPKIDWPEGWRDAMSGGDEKIKNLLARYTSPDALAKAFKDQRDALAKKPAKEEIPDLPENPTEEQLAAWRKAKGVPAKPEDYEFEVPEGKELSDGEYEILMDFAQTMHGKNMPASTVKEISAWFMEYEETIAQRNADRAFEARQDTEEKLRAEWAGDYKANINLMSNVLQEHLGTKSGDFLQMRMMDGSRLGDNETFIRLMAEVSRKIGGSTADLYTSDVQTTGKGLEARKAELLAMSTDPTREKEYRSPKIQEELTRIYAALARRAS
jgi:hypothetical protein